MTSDIMSIVPEIRSVMAGPPPRQGMCGTRASAQRLIAAMIRWEEGPAPEDPIRTCSGLARDHATRARKSVQARASAVWALTTQSRQPSVSCETAVRSVRTSKGIRPRMKGEAHHVVALIGPITVPSFSPFAITPVPIRPRAAVCARRGAGTAARPAAASPHQPRPSATLAAAMARCVSGVRS